MARTKEEIAAYDKARYLRDGEKLRQQRRDRYWRDPEKERQKKSDYDNENRELIRERERKRYDEDPDKFRNKSQKYRDLNPDKIKEYNSHNYQADPEKHKKLTIEWMKANPDKVKEYDLVKHARRKGWGFEPLNDWFLDSNFHHLHVDGNRAIGLFIPEELHRSIYHSFDNQESMNMINQAAIKWSIQHVR